MLSVLSIVAPVFALIASGYIARRIEADPRHTGVEVRIEQVGPFEPVFDDWVCGWCEADELRAIVAAPMQEPIEQLARFAGLVRRSEVA